jgi:hypothetical protein
MTNEISRLDPDSTTFPSTATGGNRPDLGHNRSLPAEFRAAGRRRSSRTCEEVRDGPMERDLGRDGEPDRSTVMEFGGGFNTNLGLDNAA